MSKSYTDAEKAAYWKKKALSGQSAPRRRYPNKSYVPKKGKHYYNYKTAENAAKRQDAKDRRERTVAPGIISSMGQMAGGALGSAIGGPAGAAMGDFFGGKLGHLVEKITGFGDYKINSNTLMRGGMSQAMIVNSSMKGGTIVRHREYIGDIVATQDFTIQKFRINPAQVNSFPWLGTSAPNWNQWRARGILYEYQSTSSDSVLSSSASTGLGSVIMATDYDALDAPYPDKRSMLNSEFASSSKPSCSFIHPIECKQSQTPTRLLFTNSTPNYPTGGDPRLYDLGNFYIATEGMQNSDSTSVIGELFVVYEIELFKPQMGPIAEDDYPTDQFALSGQTSNTWLANAVADPSNTMGGTADSATYYFPPSLTEGTFLVTYYASGTAAVLGQVNPLVSNGSLVDIWDGASNFLQAPASGVSSAGIMCEFAVKITGPNASVGFLSANLPTGTVKGYLVVTVMSATFTDETLLNERPKKALVVHK